MPFFPAFLELKGRDCLIVGGGVVALRKAKLLVRSGARLTVVAPRLAPAMSDLLRETDGRWVSREFRSTDVRGHWLVVSATGVPAVARCVAEAAAVERVFCNTVDKLTECSFITPAIVDRSPLIIAISSGGTAPVLARQLRARIETLVPKAAGAIARIAGRWRERVKAAIPDAADRRVFWERFFESANTPNVDGAGATLTSMLRAPRPARGIAWLVGAGPGDPELLTLAALQCLQTADVIVHDRLVSAAVLDLARRDAELVSVGKRPGSSRNSQEAINAMLVELVGAGKRVCRLKGGDPFIFGRGGEEMQALQDAGLAYRIVPGITAAAGCAAAAGIPLTHRDAAQSVVFLTAHGKNSVDNLDWPSLARDRQTLAIYMGVGRFSVISDRLIEYGRAADTPIAIVENGTTAEQRIVRGTLGQLPMLAATQCIHPPAILLIGEVTRRGRFESGRECSGKTNQARSEAAETDLMVAMN